MTVGEYLKGNTYPGRGVLIGLSASGGSALMAYFIMGRSENSRNRVFVPENGGLRTKAWDEGRLTDPSLVIYRPVGTAKAAKIITNGDQTDTILASLASGGSFEAALRTRNFEPDPPIFTPRVSGLAEFGEGLSYKLSILKTEDGGRSCARFFFEYAGQKGRGHLIHTYKNDGDPPEPFPGAPVALSLPASGKELASALWEALDEERRVSLWVCERDLLTGEESAVIINKNAPKEEMA